MAGKIPPEDKTFYVAADGTGDYYSIQRALDMAPKTGGAVLSVSPGVYREVLTVDKPNITIRSANPDASKTVIVNDRSAGQNGGTLHSATVNVTADDFFAENITIENDFNKTHEQTSQGSQALAILVTGDRAIFHNVRLLGNQDTVYLGTHCGNDAQNCAATRQYFSDCYVAGNVDFIFGDSKAVFENCEIHSTPHGGGYITAQSKHYPKQDSGFVFDHCKLTADPGVTGPIFLGRPWRPYATVIYMHTEMDDKIDPAGWREWHPGETPLARNRLLRRIRLHRPRRASRSARPAHAFPHARRGQAIRAGNLPARHRQLGSNQAPHSARAVNPRGRGNMETS